MKSANSNVKVVFRTVLMLALLQFARGVASAQQAKCDGLPHPENGQPAPCYPERTVPDANSGDTWRTAQQQRQQQHDQEVAEAEERERARIHKCELQSQHDYEECTRKDPNAYCRLKDCY